MDQEKYMLEAIRLAELGRGFTSPNPLVGAVIVKNGQIIGTGYHRKAGTEHAEIIALNMASSQARDAEMYVTLEPCSHIGRTPPCTERIIKAGIKKVYVGILDPNPLVAGNGIKQLQDAGIDVEVGFMMDTLLEQNRFFFHWIAHNLPYINLKYAMTLDGKIANSLGESKWITNEKSRAFVQDLRGIVDGILVGVNTVIKDNPHLTYRYTDLSDPYKIVCDSQLRIPLNCNLIKNSPHKTIIGTLSTNTEKIELLLQKGVNIIQCKPDKDNHIDILDFCTKLAQKKITSILVEGGSRIHGSFFKAGLINRIYAFIAPKLMGDTNALSPVSTSIIPSMSALPCLENISHLSFDDNILISGDFPKNRFLNFNTVEGEK